MSLVLKFGGTSLASTERVREAVARVREARALRETRGVGASGGHLVAVVSAMAGVTDTLATLVADVAKGALDIPARLSALAERHRRTLDALAPDDLAAALALETALATLAAGLVAIENAGRVEPPLHDAVLASGERLAAPLVAAALRFAGIPARAVDAADLVRTDTGFGNGNADVAATGRQVRALLGDRDDAGTVIVVPGFFGADAAGRTVLLGRGGSDTSATVLGAALGAERVEIWTDVDGVLAADPRLVAGAARLPRLGYGEAEEMATYGARVLHARALAPARDARIPILVRNSLAPEREGTWIDGAAAAPDGTVRGLATLAPPLAEPIAGWLTRRGHLPRARRDRTGLVAIVGARPSLADAVLSILCGATASDPTLRVVASPTGRSLLVLVPREALADATTRLHAALVAAPSICAAGSAGAARRAPALTRLHAEALEREGNAGERRRAAARR